MQKKKLALETKIGIKQPIKRLEERAKEQLNKWKPIFRIIRKSVDKI